MGGLVHLQESEERFEVLPSVANQTALLKDLPFFFRPTVITPKLVELLALLRW